MESLFILILLSLVVGILGFAWFMYSSKKNQFDDIEGPKYRMLNDDDEEDNYHEKK